MSENSKLLLKAIKDPVSVYETPDDVVRDGNPP